MFDDFLFWLPYFEWDDHKPDIVANIFMAGISTIPKFLTLGCPHDAPWSWDYLATTNHW